MKVRRISAQDTYAIRKQVLVPGLDAKMAKFPNDDDEDLSFHLGAFLDGKLVSIASFFYEQNKIFSDEHQYQLRGMATLEKYRNQGLSEQLLNTAFPIIKQNLCTLVWCNARVSACGFYEKVGFRYFKENEEFDVPNVGPHKLMYRTI